MRLRVCWLRLDRLQAIYFFIAAAAAAVVAVAFLSNEAFSRYFSIICVCVWNEACYSLHFRHIATARTKWKRGMNQQRNRKTLVEGNDVCAFFSASLSLFRFFFFFFSICDWLSILSPSSRSWMNLHWPVGGFTWNCREKNRLISRTIPEMMECKSARDRNRQSNQLKKIATAKTTMMMLWLLWLSLKSFKL